MSVSSMNRMLFTEQRQKKVERRWHLAFWILCVTLAATASHLAAILIAHRVGFETAMAMEAAKPKRAPIVEARPAFPGLVECVRMCRAVDRMERVK